MAESMQGLKRTHRCGELSAVNVGETVTIMGWVQKNRNKGGLVFTDVRDRSGIIQVVCEEGTTEPALIEKAASLRSEYVVAIVGKVARRSGAVNDKIATGEIEVIPSELRILSEAMTPPFPIEENSKTKEEIRLKYRYLDLRRPDLQRNLKMKSQVMTLTRQYFAEEGFLEVETPMLGKTTPEGARDYLVPSRVHPGSFYGLPQSPQLYKQLLMCSGVDRYIQIARCFRDEDLRADRQPEFTQIDMELSFVDVDDVIDVNERYLKKLFREVLDVEVQLPIQRMTWQEAMDRFGSDKPDLRFGMELTDVSEVVKDCGFGVFTAALENGGSVRGINAKGQGGMPRKKIDKLTAFVKDYGAKGRYNDRQRSGQCRRGRRDCGALGHDRRSNRGVWLQLQNYADHHRRQAYRRKRQGGELCQRYEGKRLCRIRRHDGERHRCREQRQGKSADCCQ